MDQQNLNILIKIKLLEHSDFVILRHDLDFPRWEKCEKFLITRKNIYIPL